MSIDNCQVCDKQLDTDFVEYQDDGTLLCDGCLDEMENEQESYKVYVKTDGPVPAYLTAGKVYEVDGDEEAGWITFDNGDIEFIYVKACSWLKERPWALCDQHGNPVAEQKAESRCTMGVGDGAGKLFVHGDYDSIKAAQNIVLERDRYKALAGELAEALEHLTFPKVCWCEADTKDSRLQFHTWECNTARATLAKYNEQEKEV